MIFDIVLGIEGALAFSKSTQCGHGARGRCGMATFSIRDAFVIAVDPSTEEEVRLLEVLLDDLGIKKTQIKLAGGDQVAVLCDDDGLEPFLFTREMVENVSGQLQEMLASRNRMKALRSFFESERQ